MRRIGIVSAIFITVSMCFLMSCAKKPDLEPAEKKQLELWHYWEQPYARQALRQVVNRFNRENEDVEITIKYVPDEDFKKQLSLSMADGTMPALAMIDSADVQYFYQTGYLENVDDIVDQGVYLDQAIASCLTADGGVCGIPVGCNCLMFFYNEDMMDAAGIEPPETLEEFVEAAKCLSGDGVYGCAFPALQSEESLFCFLPILWAKGGSILRLDDEAGSEAFDFLRQLSTSGAMSHETVNMSLSDVEREFKKGRVAMMFTTSMSVRGLEEEDLGFHLGIARLPVAPQNLSIVGGEVLAVTNGRWKAEARRFLEYMAEPEQMKGYMDAMGYLAPRQDVLDWQLEQNPGLKSYVEVMNTARTREFWTKWPQASLAIADTISRVILHEDTPETFVELADKIRGIWEELE